MAAAMAAERAFGAQRRLASTRFDGKNVGGGGIWKQILEQAARTTEFPASHILLLGRKDVGKSSILRALQHIGCGQQKVTEMEYYQDTDGVSALDYAYINVRNIDDEDPSESLAKTNVWILQDVKHKEFLSEYWRPEYLKHALMMICLDLSQPWSLRDEMKFWLDFVNEFLQPLFVQLTVEDQEALRDQMAHYCRTYKTSVTKETAHDFAKRHAEDTSSPEMEDGIVYHQINLGVPIVVVVCKSDYAEHLDTRATQGFIDVIEAHLRQLCLPYGAALVYCNAKDTLTSRNLELLYRYLMHRIHDFDFSEVAKNDQKDATFFPAGWDSQAEVEEFAKKTLAEGFQKPYGSIITRGATQTSTALRVAKEEGENADVEDMHLFLHNLLSSVPSLAMGPVKAERSPSHSRHDSLSTPSHGRERKTSRQSGGEPGETGRSSVRRSQIPDPTTSARGDPASLRSFFQTLLVKGKPVTPRVPPDMSTRQNTSLPSPKSVPLESVEDGSPPTRTRDEKVSSRRRTKHSHSRSPPTSKSMSREMVKEDEAKKEKQKAPHDRVKHHSSPKSDTKQSSTPAVE